MYWYLRVANRRVKKVKQRNRDSVVRETGAIVVLLLTEAIVGMDKGCEDCLKVFRLSWKAPSPLDRSRDIIAQISRGAFYDEGIIFVVTIKNMLSRE